VGSVIGDWSLHDAKIMSPEEVQRILQRAKEAGEIDEMFQRDYDWMMIAVNSSLRLSEVAHIEKEDVLPTRLMMIRRKKRHLFPAPIEVMPAVHAILKRRADAVDGGYIFPGRCKPCIIYRQSKKHGPSQEQVCVGGHASLRSIQRRWRLLITELGLYKHGRGIHTLRHVAITEMYRLTRDLRKAQVFAGHSSSKITETYAHVTDMQETLAAMKPLL